MNEPHTDDAPITFSINENENSFSFEAVAEQVKEQYGDLTLSPKAASE